MYSRWLLMGRMFHEALRARGVPTEMVVYPGEGHGIRQPHAQERSLLEAVYPLVRTGDVWVADRNFCTLGLLWGILGRGGFFVLRQHGGLGGERLGQRKAKGRCETGRVYEQRLRLQNEVGQVLVVRRITVAPGQPTREGDTEIHVLTNLPADKV